MIIVADASAVASFLIPDQADTFAQIAFNKCLTETVHVPAHWPVELANILWKASRRRRIATADRDEIFSVAGRIQRIVTTEAEVDIRMNVDRALQTGLTAYDTGYLLLAERLHAQLLTRDGDLACVARDAGLSVLAP